MKILVTGGTGNVGRRLVERLATRPGVSVRVLTRDPSRAAFGPGVDVVRGDLADLDGLAAVLEGVDRLFLFPLAYPSGPSQSLDEYVVTSAVPELAAKAGVQRVVLLSSNAVMYGRDPHHQQAEAAVEESGLDFTLLRPGEFAMNKVLAWGGSIRSEGVVRSGFPDVKGVPIHEADVAAVAEVALVEDGHAGARYELTGAEVLTEREQVAAIAAGAGREIRFEVLTPDQARQDWIKQGIMPELVDEIMDHYRHFTDNPPRATDTVAETTGVRARTLEEWAADHAADFR
jgi:uncharacterized protein YbjT (DUF2867 family)